MKKINYLAMMTLAVLTIGLSACNDDYWNNNDGYDSRLVGHWTSTFGNNGKGEFDLLSTEVDAYVFYDNNRGYYGFYESRGGALRWIEVDFRWVADRYNRVARVDYADGKSENLYYEFDRYGALLISRNYNMYPYIGYEAHAAGSQIVGNWRSYFEADGNQRWEIPSNKIDEYRFFDNRVGDYSYYNDNGQWVTVGFIWRMNGNGAMEARYDDGVTEQLYYSYNGSDLLISRQPTFASYIGYRRF